MEMIALIALLACAPRAPDWARAVEPLPEAALRVVLDEQGRVWLDGQELSTTETNGQLDALTTAAGARLPRTILPLDGDTLRARVWLDPSRPFGEARKVLSALQTARASAWDLEASPGLDAGWPLPIPYWDGVPHDDEVAWPPPPVLILRTEGDLLVSQKDPLAIRLPDGEGGLDRVGLASVLGALAPRAHEDAEMILILDDRVSTGDLTRALDTIVAETGLRPQIGGGPDLARPTEAPSPTPPARVLVPRRVEIGRDGRMALEFTEGSADIYAHEILVFWSSCTAGRCAIVAQPRWGPSWLIAERPQVQGLEASWILGRPVQAWPEDRALPTERPTTTGLLPLLPWLVSTDPSAGPGAAFEPTIYMQRVPIGAIVEAVGARAPALRTCVAPGVVPASARIMISRTRSISTSVHLVGSSNLSAAEQSCIASALAALDSPAFHQGLLAEFTLLFEEGVPRVLVEP